MAGSQGFLPPLEGFLQQWLRLDKVSQLHLSASPDRSTPSTCISRAPMMLPSDPGRNEDSPKVMKSSQRVWMLVTLLVLERIQELLQQQHCLCHSLAVSQS